MRRLSDEIQGRLEMLAAKVAAADFEEPTFRCYWCLDRGYTQAPSFNRFGNVYSAARPCGNCDTGRAVGNKKGDAYKRERERLEAKKAGRFVSVEEEVPDDDIPF